MKKFIVPIAVIAIIAVALYSWVVGINNTAVTYEADAKTAWSKVESAYQRRTDLYNTILKTVKASAEFEKSTLREVIEARSKATSIEINVDDLTPENIAKFQQAQNQFSGSFSKLLATFERYPDLKTTTAFQEFMAQQEGTENRINVARDRYNDAVNIYDIYTTKFPNKIFASWFGFKEMARFKADKGAEKVPDLNF